jgi:hypothetical protein
MEKQEVEKEEKRVGQARQETVSCLSCPGLGALVLESSLQASCRKNDHEEG